MKKLQKQRTASSHKKKQTTKCPHCQGEIEIPNSDNARSSTFGRILSWTFSLFLLIVVSLGIVEMRIIHTMMSGERTALEQKEPVLMALREADEGGDNKTVAKLETVTTDNHSAIGASTMKPPVKKLGAISTVQSTGPNKIHKHAIITPYRNRPYHYETFAGFMDQYLQEHFNQSNTEFSWWIIEQYDDELFNRGWLANVGLAEIFKAEPDTECITFHDIDLIPDTNDRHGGVKVVKGPVYYNKCERPTQIGSELSHFNWNVPYEQSAGGVTTLHAKHWKQINGFSNDYVGWGGEDDDHFHRLRLNNLLDQTTQAMARPPKGYGRFRTISQKVQHHGRPFRDEANYAIVLKILNQMENNSPRWRHDGLTDLQYIVASRDDGENDHAGSGFKHIHHVKARQQLLEFVHIPKTAGSSIEIAAAKAGIPWGACHFNHALNEEMGCPDPPNFQQLGLTVTVPALSSVSIWHVPPHQWNINLFHGKKTFTVVRNPYSLALSIYYDKWVGYDGEGNKNHPDTLNLFLKQWFERPPPLFRLTQSDYVTYPKGIRKKGHVTATDMRVDHILKFERLEEEFRALMQQYHLDDRIQLQAAHNNEAPVAKGSKKLGIEHLSNTTLRLIERHYAPDFALFNYTMMT